MSQITKSRTLPIPIEVSDGESTSEYENYIPYREVAYGAGHGKTDMRECLSTDSTFNTDAPTPVASKPKVLVKQTISKATKQRILRNWEGVIQVVRDDYFEAILVDMTGSNPDELVEMEFDEIDEPDRHLISDGAVFYFTVFQNIKPSGTVQTASEIRFKRSIALHPEDESEISSEAARMFEFFQNE